MVTISATVMCFPFRWCQFLMCAPATVIVADAVLFGSVFVLFVFLIIQFLLSTGFILPSRAVLADVFPLPQCKQALLSYTLLHCMTLSVFPWPQVALFYL